MRLVRIFRALRLLKKFAPPPLSASPSLSFAFSPSLPPCLPASLPPPLPPSLSPFFSPFSLPPFLPPSLPPSLPSSLHISLPSSLPPSFPPSLPSSLPRSFPRRGRADLAHIRQSGPESRPGLQVKYKLHFQMFSCRILRAIRLLNKRVPPPSKEGTTSNVL